MFNSWDNPGELEAMAAHLFNDNGQLQDVDIPDLFEVLAGGEDEVSVKNLLGLDGEDSDIGMDTEDLISSTELATALDVQLLAPLENSPLTVDSLKDESIDAPLECVTLPPLTSVQTATTTTANTTTPTTAPTKEPTNLDPVLSKVIVIEKADPAVPTPPKPTVAKPSPATIVLPKVSLTAAGTPRKREPVDPSRCIYACENCRKAFTTKFNLKRHINMHCLKSRELGVPLQGPPSASQPSRKRSEPVAVKPVDDKAKKVKKAAPNSTIQISTMTEASHVPTKTTPTTILRNGNICTFSSQQPVSYQLSGKPGGGVQLTTVPKPSGEWTSNHEAPAATRVLSFIQPLRIQPQTTSVGGGSLVQPDMIKVIRGLTPVNQPQGNQSGHKVLRVIPNAVVTNAGGQDRPTSGEGYQLTRPVSHQIYQQQTSNGRITLTHKQPIRFPQQPVPIEQAFNGRQIIFNSNVTATPVERKPSAAPPPAVVVNSLATTPLSVIPSQHEIGKVPPDNLFEEEEEEDNSSSSVASEALEEPAELNELDGEEDCKQEAKSTISLLPANGSQGVLTSIPEGWIRKVVMSESGFQKVFYYNKNGKKFSNMDDVNQYFAKLGYSTTASGLFKFNVIHEGHDDVIKKLAATTKLRKKAKLLSQKQTCDSASASEQGASITSTCSPSSSTSRFQTEEAESNSNATGISSTSQN